MKTINKLLIFVALIVCNVVLVQGQQGFDAVNEETMGKPVVNPVLKSNDDPCCQDILLLGNAVTDGFPNFTFRFSLYLQLTNAGYNFDFVGNEDYFNDQVYPTTNWDMDHEGHTGWPTADIDSALNSWLPSYTADIALIYLGTDDMLGVAFQGTPLSESENAMMSIITKLRADNPNVSIYLAQNLPWGNLDNPAFTNALNAATDDWNTSLANMAATMSTNASPIYVVDMNTGFSDNDLLDGVHPTSGGANKMASRWFQALSANWEPTDCNETQDNSTIRAFTLLEGTVNSGLAMTTDLDDENLFPLTDPYSQMDDFTHVNNPFGTETVSPGLINTGIYTDWVFVEVRSPQNPQTVLATRSVLLKNNGQLVDVNNEPELSFNLPQGVYYLAIRHRNHLGIMTALPVNFGSSTGNPPIIDFRNPNTQTWGNSARKVINGSTAAMWAGDMDSNGSIIFQGPNADPMFAFFEVLNANGNPNSSVTFIAEEYSSADSDLNGQIIFQGNNNENNKAFFNVIDYPGNTTGNINYIIEEQLP